MDHCCLRGNNPAHTTVAKTQASLNWDSQEEPSKMTQTQDKPLYFSDSNSLRSENVGKIPDKKAREEKKKQRRFDREQARKNTSTLARKDLSQITCINCDKKWHYFRSCPKLRKDHDASN